MSEKCPECGAVIAPYEKCRDRFDLYLAKEFQDPTAFGAVHHLTVVCYMLQHNGYSREGWLDARKMLAQFVREGVTPSSMRKQNRAKLDSGKRDWSITKGTKLVRVQDIKWTRSIADVRQDDSEAYCADVKQWASSVLVDSETLHEYDHRK